MSPRQSHAEGRLAFCTYLLLNQGKLLEVALQERHLLLLSFAITVADDIVVLLFDLIQLDLELNNLQKKSQFLIRAR